MADSGKIKSPGTHTTKSHEGGSKKRRRHKKSAEAAGDGAPSSAALKSNQSQTLGTPKQHTPEMMVELLKSLGTPSTQSHPASHLPESQLHGGTASITGIPKQGAQDSNKSKGPSVKSGNQQNDAGIKTSEATILGTHLDKESKVTETSGKKSQKKGSKEEFVIELTGQNAPEQKNKSEKDLDLLVKDTTKQKSKGEKDIDLLGKDTTKQENKERKVSELTGKNTPKLEGNEKKGAEPPKKDSLKQEGKARVTSEMDVKEVPPGKDKWPTEPPGKGPQQKGASQATHAPGQKNKADGEKTLGCAEAEQKSKSKADAQTVRKSESSDNEHRAKGKQEAGKKTENVDGDQKSKSQLRAERRAFQEAQRAAKEAKKMDTAGSSLPGAANSGGTVAAKKESFAGKQKPAEVVNGKTPSKKKSAAAATNQDETDEQMWQRKETEILGKYLKIDNSILNLGFQYFHHHIVGANARCMALLATLREVITKYRTPVGKELSRDLEKNFLTPCITYINYCRPLSTSMGNAIKYLKYCISQISRDTDDETAIKKLQNVIDGFIQYNITKAAEAVAEHAITKINDGDVILVYAASSLIGQVLKTAFSEGKKFRVIVVEGRPRTEGKTMLRFLVRCGIPCSFVYIGSASHAMGEATKVFLGAAAMFAIGDMQSRIGNSMIAALAKANNIPVLVCCETYKFTDKVQLHLGDSNLHTRGKDLIYIGHRSPVLANWEEIGLKLLNIMYDVTGSENITALITELGLLPCTSVPAVLRRQEDEFIQTKI